MSFDCPYRVEPGSLSEEAGLRVGDQVLDINGHSFLSILHFEAVHILRSYTTLIMTIKVTSRIHDKANAGKSHACNLVVQSSLSLVNFFFELCSRWEEYPHSNRMESRKMDVCVPIFSYKRILLQFPSIFSYIGTEPYHSEKVY